MSDRNELLAELKTELQKFGLAGGEWNKSLLHNEASQGLYGVQLVEIRMTIKNSLCRIVELCVELNIEIPGSIKEQCRERGIPLNPDEWSVGERRELEDEIEKFRGWEMQATAGLSTPVCISNFMEESQEKIARLCKKLNVKVPPDVADYGRRQFSTLLL